MAESNPGQEASQEASALNEKSQVIQALLPQVLGRFQPEMSVAVDTVTATVKSQDILSACQTLKENPQLAFNFLLCLSVVDYEDHLQVVYHLYSTTRKHKMALKADIPADEPRLSSVVSVWPAANWFEREGHDLYGVLFEGHPDLSPLLLYEGFEGHPGLRSYPFNEYTEW